jgi:hypothetical protein
MITPFAVLSRGHACRGVYWWVSYRGRKEVHFWSFHRHKTMSFDQSAAPPPEGKGMGAACLREVLALADYMGVVVVLGCSVPKLWPYYESFGFVVDPWHDLPYSKRYRRHPKGGRHEVSC